LRAAWSRRPNFCKNWVRPLSVITPPPWRKLYRMNEKDARILPIPIDIIYRFG
jgi:hypothetical protein